MTHATTLHAYSAYRVRIPLRTPYHLSKVYGTLTHSDSILLRVETAGGAVGWGEGDPGGKRFTGDTPTSVMEAIRAGALDDLLGVDLSTWVEQQHGRAHTGTLGALRDVAIHDAFGRLTERPVWQLLGSQKRQRIDLLWPTSSGTAEDDLAILRDYAAQGFRTFMLKMGDRPIAEDLARIRQVVTSAPDGVRVMADANQGWTRDEAQAFMDGIQNLPVLLVEQPIAAEDLEGLQHLSGGVVPVSVDESLQDLNSVEQILAAEAADVFSIKISKNGGLQNSLAIGTAVAQHGKRILMNSMIELGITQAASLHLGCVLDRLMDCGHAYMSTLRMADDVTDFSSWIDQGTATLPDAPGLGVQVDEAKIRQYLVEEHHGSR